VELQHWLWLSLLVLLLRCWLGLLLRCWLGLLLQLAVGPPLAAVLLLLLLLLCCLVLQAGGVQANAIDMHTVPTVIPLLVGRGEALYIHRKCTRGGELCACKQKKDGRVLGAA